jgi:asparagine synthase (glutamine-hydrolysing)
MELHLSKLHWDHRNDLWVTGFILSGEIFLRGEELLDYFSGTLTLNEFEEKLKSANGQFSVIIVRKDETWIATDRLRNWPLFYTRIEGKFILSDDSYKLTGLRSDNQFDPEAYNSFLASGYVINHRTLISEIFQVEAGSLVVLGDGAKRHFYHNPAAGIINPVDLKTGSDELEKILQDVFRNYFHALKERFIAIPLSGGYDSRLVALMASKYHPENILCYTYGRKDNPEVELAMEVANRLKIKWINIVYDTELVGDFINDDFFQKYYPWASDLTGMFFLQEYFAVRHLKTNNVIPSDSVFISGYSGDFIAGSYLTPSMHKSMNKNDLSRLIYSEYFRLVNLSKYKRSALCELISESIPSGSSQTWKVVEGWDMKERHSKFIINSAKVFSFFGYEYVFPLWDNRLVDYMLDIPFSLRMDRTLYEHTLRDHIFKENSMNLQLETNPSPVRKSYQRLKEALKPLLPAAIRDLFIDPYNPILYDEITRILLEDLDPDTIIKPRQPNYYNSYIIQWYLAKTSEKLNIRMN